MKKNITIKEIIEEFDRKFPLPKILALSGGKGVERDAMKNWLRITLTQRHEAEVAETYKQAQKDFFSMDLIASFLDFVPDEHKDMARQSYIDAVGERVRKFYTFTKTDKQ